MLTTCPECELQVSDKARACPHCGYPMNETAAPKYKRPSSKRKRLPNGFGQISEIKGQNLRNPYRVMITVGKDENGKPIAKLLKPQAYFPTYNDAYAALVEYNKNPYDLDNDITVKELYEKWRAERTQNIADSTAYGLTYHWEFCSAVYDMRVKDIRVRHIKACMDEGWRVSEQGRNKGKRVYASAHAKKRIKGLFNSLLDYAMEYEIVNINYARSFDLPNEVRSEIASRQKSHMPFTDEEMATLWKNINKVNYIDWILIQCYMGWRPGELIELELENINLEKWYMTGGKKTEAGKDRIVPIHTAIRPLVQKNYDFALSVHSKYLLNDTSIAGTPTDWYVTYPKYTKRFKLVMGKLDMDHVPHDPRVTFITLGKKYGVDEYALKSMVGHSVRDITEATYTVRDLEWLRSDLEKIKVPV